MTEMEYTITTPQVISTVHFYEIG